MSKMKEHLSKLDYYDGFHEGMKEGIKLYAWWKDGIQYVGTTGRTLAEALREAEKLSFSVKHSGCEPSELR